MICRQDSVLLSKCSVRLYHKLYKLYNITFSPVRQWLPYINILIFEQPMLLVRVVTIFVVSRRPQNAQERNENVQHQNDAVL